MMATLSALTSNSELLNTATMALSFDEMPDDSLFHIFEFLNLECLCQISKTSVNRHLHNTMKNYLKYRFKNEMVSIKAKNNKVVLTLTPIPNDAIHQITIHGNKQQAFHHVALNFSTNLTKIVFKDLLPKKCKESDELAKIIEKPLESLRVVGFCVNKFNGKIYDEILKKCANLHELFIISNSTKQDWGLMKRRPNDYYQNKWYFMLYPKLETIQWDAGYVDKADEFGVLFANNPQIKNLKISRNVFEAIDFIESHVLSLNKLSIEFNLQKAANITDICYKLNDLYNNGHYERLYLTIGLQSILNNNIREIASLKMLESISFNGKYISAIGQFSNLKELSIDALEDGTEIAEQLPLLKKLFIQQGILKAIIPLVRNSVNLVRIVIKKVVHQSLGNFDSINMKRNELNGAKPMIIYLEEWAYLKLFWTENNSGFSKLIEIRRADSYISDA